MSHPADCPQNWEYTQHPRAAEVGVRCQAILVRLGRDEIDVTRGARDTHPFHAEMFNGLTPDRCPYFAGSYRGEGGRCLRHYAVRVPADHRVGTAPSAVQREMANFTAQILNRGMKEVQASFDQPDGKLSSADKLNNLVVYICRVLVEFFRIHPYANGNGHIGRLIVWFLLVKYGYWPKRWPLDQRPPYGQLIYRYRDGDHAPLHAFILSAIG
jgi:hypothetical protein